MPVSTKTKALAGLAALDLARQVATAWAARERARDAGSRRLRGDVARLARDVRRELPEVPRWQLERGWPPITRRSTTADAVRSWAPVGLLVVASVAGVVATARVIARREPEGDAAIADAPPVAAAVRSGAQAIDAGVQKVAEGGSSLASGTAGVVAAGSSAVRSATIDQAKNELDERVVQPAKRRAVTIGAVGIAALTAYVIIVAAVVTLLVGAIA
jgi:hypothetical protein